MFDKEAQRRRAAEFSAEQIAKGKLPPRVDSIPVKAMPVRAEPVKTVYVPPTSKKTYLEEPFTNDIGQVINVGDRIIAVTTGYSHDVRVHEGVYLGKRLQDRSDKVRNVTVRLKRKNWGYFLPDGTVAARGHNQRGAEWKKGIVESISTLPRARIYALA